MRDFDRGGGSYRLFSRGKRKNTEDQKMEIDSFEKQEPCNTV